MVEKIPIDPVPIDVSVELGGPLERPDRCDLTDGWRGDHEVLGQEFYGPDQFRR